MKRPAKALLEKEYSIVLSDKKPYILHSSIEYLNQNGRLADLRIMGRVLFQLCDIIDKQQIQIDELLTQINGQQPTTQTARPNATPLV